MKIQQISLFLENKPGRLGEPCRVLAENGVNIVTLSLADTEQFGILRLIVRDWEKAKRALEAAGFAVNITEVVGTEVPDRPGGLAEVLDIVERSGINIEYMYAFAFRSEDKAALVFRFDKPDDAIALLQSNGVNVLGGVALFERIER